MFERILVAFDGSQPSRKAIHVAVELAERFGASLTLAMVRPPGSEPRDVVLESLVPLPGEGKAFSAVVDEVRATAMARGAKAVDSVVLHGDVIDTLLGWIHEHHPDLVVVGSRELSRGQRLILGSVSGGLIQRAPCPVLVVRGTRRASVHPPRPVVVPAAAGTSARTG
jgi:nucleotide-binding universal stress UspA family protein